jgi:hypothetical protein
MVPFAEEFEGDHGGRRAANMRRRLKDSKQLEWLKGGERGSQVFIFNCRERIRAMDWMWEIWKDLDGILPETLEVYVPDLQTTIKLARPIEDSVGSMATCRELSRSKILKTAVDALRRLPTFDMLVESARRETNEMLRLELAWKREEYLEWISKQDEKRSEGSRREWSLLAGLSIISVSMRPSTCTLLAAKTEHNAICDIACPLCPSRTARRTTFNIGAETQRWKQAGRTAMRRRLSLSPRPQAGQSEQGADLRILLQRKPVFFFAETSADAASTAACRHHWCSDRFQAS